MDIASRNMLGIDARKTPLHYLHIPKTAGSAVRFALQDMPTFIKGGHNVTMYTLPPGKKIFFTVRDVQTRFCSGFYSRKRKGRPLNDTEWTNYEELVFTTFETPEELVQGFISPNVAHRKIATLAFQHVMLLRPLAYWLRSRDYCLSRYNDIVYILEQESLAEDFEVLKSIWGIEFSLPKGKVHRNPRDSDYFLSESSQEILNAIYAEDLLLLDACHMIKDAKLEQYRKEGLVSS